VLTYTTLRQGMSSLDGWVSAGFDGLLQVHGEIGMVPLDLRLDVLVDILRQKAGLRRAKERKGCSRLDLRRDHLPRL
jgi:hypothetical protein